jgi:hypothetical protein
MTSATDEDAAVAVGPVPVVSGANVTVTAVGAIVPAGNPEPVTVTTFTSGCAVDGDAMLTSVTLV